MTNYQSKYLKKLDEHDRLSILKELNPTDLSFLMNIFLQALKKEDYEVCDVSKTLLLERGYEIPS